VRRLIFARRVSTPCNHVARTFAFGEAVAERQRIAYDRELFYVAAMLHDLGLSRLARGAERFESRFGSPWRVRAFAVLTFDRLFELVGRHGPPFAGQSNRGLGVAAQGTSVKATEICTKLMQPIGASRHS